MTFRIEGDEKRATVEVHDMAPRQVVSVLRRCLMTAYGRAGQTMNEDDLTLSNMLMGELQESINEMAKARRRHRVMLLVLYLSVGVNVGAALYNLFGH
jgi:hypothetical protein